MSSEESEQNTEQPLARPEFWDEIGPGFERVFACGGTEDDPHMVPMEFVEDAATPYAECTHPDCTNRAFLHNQRTSSLCIDDSEDSYGEEEA